MNDIIVFDDIDKNGPQTYSGTFDLSLKEVDRPEVESVGPVAIEAKADRDEGEKDDKDNDEDEDEVSFS